MARQVAREPSRAGAGEARPSRGILSGRPRSASHLILASESTARRRLLARLGYKFHAIATDVDEDFYKLKIKSPIKLARTLALAKARAIQEFCPNDVIIGADQVLVYAGKVYGKPHTEARAREQLQKFAGRRVQLITAVAVLSPRHQTVFVDKVKMQFRHLSSRDIRAYVERDRPLSCAGSFMFEKTGVALFSKVHASDLTSIEGLPLIRLHQALLKTGRLKT